jgi:hypothetical protein
LIDVRDMARAIEWAISRPTERGGQFLALNVGSNAWNDQVKDLAHAVAASVRETTVSINTDAPPDKRSYRLTSVSSRSWRQSINRSRRWRRPSRVFAGLRAINFSDRNFRQSQLIRLKVLQRQIERNRLDADLVWH